MFANSSSPKRPAIASAKLSGLIAEDVEIAGDLHFSGGLRLDGRIVGNVALAEGEGRAALLIVSESGCVEGSVRCLDAVINGTIIGDLWVENFLELQPKARVTGTIRYRALRMDVGAAVDGRLVPIDAVVPALASRNVLTFETEQKVVGA